MTPRIGAVHQWACPNCDREDVTFEARPHSHFNVCPGLRGLSAPMIPAGTRAKVELREREDYVGDDEVQTDAEGRPVMSVVTTRDDGQDVTVFASVARAKVGS